MASKNDNFNHYSHDICKYIKIEGKQVYKEYWSPWDGEKYSNKVTTAVIFSNSPFYGE